MNTKICSNRKCPASEHFVYTVDTRCVLCRWDLKPSQRSTRFPREGGSDIFGIKSRKDLADYYKGRKDIAETIGL